MNNVLEKKKVNSQQSGPQNRLCLSEWNKSLSHFLAIIVAVLRRKDLSSEPGGCIVQTWGAQALW